jgi:hypothetical protein
MIQKLFRFKHNFLSSFTIYLNDTIFDSVVLVELNPAIAG